MDTCLPLFPPLLRLKVWLPQEHNIPPNLFFQAEPIPRNWKGIRRQTGDTTACLREKLSNGCICSRGGSRKWPWAWLSVTPPRLPRPPPPTQITSYPYQSTSWYIRLSPVPSSLLSAFILLRAAFIHLLFNPQTSDEEVAPAL